MPHTRATLSTYGPFATRPDPSHRGTLLRRHTGEDNQNWRRSGNVHTCAHPPDWLLGWDRLQGHCPNRIRAHLPCPGVL